MLPQVANHILHHTSRAVAAAQNQAGQTLRNVLGFQTGTTPSSTTGLTPWNNNTGSSSWGSGHAGAGGGPKFHPGSRFYSGYKVSHLSPVAFGGSISILIPTFSNRAVLLLRQILLPQTRVLPTQMTPMSPGRHFPKPSLTRPASRGNSAPVVKASRLGPTLLRLLNAPRVLVF